MSESIIVGAGLMGTWHAHAVASPASVIAVVDPDLGQARALASRYGATAHTTLRPALDASPGAVVHICTPPDQHESSLDLALTAGHHVVCEKPVTPTYSGTVRMIELAEARGAHLTPVLQFGFQPWADKLDQVGPTVTLDHSICSVGGEGLGDADLAPLAWGILWHGLALVERVVGKSALSQGEWMAQSTRPGEVRVSGTTGRVSVSLSVSLMGRPPRNEVVVVGTGGTLRADLFHGYGAMDPAGSGRAAKALRPFRRASGDMIAAATNLGRRTRDNEPAFPGLSRLIAAAHAAARGEGPPPLSHQNLLDVAVIADRLRSQAER